MRQITTALGVKKISIALGLAALLMQGCSDKPKEEQSTATEVAKEEKQEVAPANLYGVSTQVASSAPKGANVQSNSQHTAQALEVVDAAGYTYVKVNEDGNVYWIAGPKVSIEQGSKISYVEQMVMQDFTSKALNKTFDQLMFTTTIIPANGAAQTAAKEHDCDTCGPTADAKAAAAANAAHGQSTTKKVDLSNINVAKVAGGYSVEELYSKSADLKDKTVKVQAKVVKVSRNIMGKDWVHIQDGTGSDKTSDIVITGKNAPVEVGDVVIADATLKTDVDFGYGYFFAVILEEGKFTKQ